MLQHLVSQIFEEAEHHFREQVDKSLSKIDCEKIVNTSLQNIKILACFSKIYNNCSEKIDKELSEKRPKLIICWRHRQHPKPTRQPFFTSGTQPE